MAAKTFSQLLVDLDILASYSRPRTADDNPDSESQFKTVKYAPAYPGRFADPKQARGYFRSFFVWYNTRHRHSGLGLLTPEAVHHGHAEEFQSARQRILDDLCTRHPERFVNGPLRRRKYRPRCGSIRPRPPSNAHNQDSKLSLEVSHFHCHVPFCLEQAGLHIHRCPRFAHFEGSNSPFLDPQLPECPAFFRRPYLDRRERGVRQPRSEIFRRLSSILCSEIDPGTVGTHGRNRRWQAAGNGWCDSGRCWNKYIEIEGV